MEKRAHSKLPNVSGYFEQKQKELKAKFTKKHLDLLMSGIF